jgi:hypothetical protein
MNERRRPDFWGGGCNAIETEPALAARLRQLHDIKS